MHQQTHLPHLILPAQHPTAPLPISILGRGDAALSLHTPPIPAACRQSAPLLFGLSSPLYPPSIPRRRCCSTAPIALATNPSSARGRRHPAWLRLAVGIAGAAPCLAHPSSCASSVTPASPRCPCPESPPSRLPCARRVALSAVGLPVLRLSFIFVSLDYLLSSSCFAMAATTVLVTVCSLTTVLYKCVGSRAIGTVHFVEIIHALIFGSLNLEIYDAFKLRDGGSDYLANLLSSVSVRSSSMAPRQLRNVGHRVFYKCPPVGSKKISAKRSRHSHGSPWHLPAAPAVVTCTGSATRRPVTLSEVGTSAGSRACDQELREQSSPPSRLDDEVPRCRIRLPPPPAPARIRPGDSGGCVEAPAGRGRRGRRGPVGAAAVHLARRGGEGRGGSIQGQRRKHRCREGRGLPGREGGREQGRRRGEQLLGHRPVQAGEQGRRRVEVVLLQAVGGLHVGHLDRSHEAPQAQGSARQDRILDRQVAARAHRYLLPEEVRLPGDDAGDGGGGAGDGGRDAAPPALAPALRAERRLDPCAAGGGGERADAPHDLHGGGRPQVVRARARPGRAGRLLQRLLRRLPPLPQVRAPRRRLPRGGGHPLIHRVPPRPRGRQDRERPGPAHRHRLLAPPRRRQAQGRRHRRARRRGAPPRREPLRCGHPFPGAGAQQDACAARISLTSTEAGLSPANM